MANSIEAVSEAFKLSVESMRNSSPLYEFLASQVADDPEILEVARVGREEQFPPLIFFGAVRYLLLGEAEGHELETFYLDLCDSPDQARAPQDAYPIFRQFCLDYKEAIQHIITTRLIQTNEVRRCVVMVPAFNIVAASTDQPLVLIEIGSSVGLNLNWDCYHYHYHYTGKADLFCGQSDSLLTLTTEIRGEQVPPIPTKLPTVIDRKGIDLNPLDPTDEKVRRWLHALIWPEHIKRWQNLDRALNVLQDHPLELIAGNALDVLSDVLHGSAGEGALCIFHSMTIYQFSAQMRQKLDDILMEHSHQRDIYRVWFEWEPENGMNALRLFTYKQGAKVGNMLATADPHGQWMQWQGDVG